jgi:hypothetical protein
MAQRPPSDRPFSNGWLFLSVGVFLAIEAAIGTYLGPLVLGKYVSPAFHLQLQSLMHLASFYLGGVVVGLMSPGVRLKEPAAGAFLSVLAVFVMSLFLPHTFMQFDVGKILIGGAIAVVLALMGAYTGEKMMGNVAPDDDDAQATARGRMRSALWNSQDGYLAARERVRRGRE